MMPIEDVPNGCKLYYRIHKNYMVNGALIPGVFREIGDGDKKSMSTDWGKYSSANDSRYRAKNPDSNGIVSLNVGHLRSIQLEVIHSPDEILNNQAHTDVKMLNGNKQRIQLELIRNYRWVIPIIT